MMVLFVCIILIHGTQSMNQKVDEGEIHTMSWYYENYEDDYTKKEQKKFYKKNQTWVNGQLKAGNNALAVWKNNTKEITMNVGLATKKSEEEIEKCRQIAEEKGHKLTSYIRTKDYIQKQLVADCDDLQSVKCDTLSSIPEEKECNLNGLNKLQRKIINEGLYCTSEHFYGIHWFEDDSGTFYLVNVQLCAKTKKGSFTLFRKDGKRVRAWVPVGKKASPLLRFNAESFLEKRETKSKYLRYQLDAKKFTKPTRSQLVHFFKSEGRRRLPAVSSTSTSTYCTFGTFLLIVLAIFMLIFVTLFTTATAPQSKERRCSLADLEEGRNVM